MFNNFAISREKRHLKKLEKEIVLRESMWEVERPLIERQNKLKKEYKTLTQKVKEKPSWSKLLLTFLFVNFTILEGFIAWATIKSFSLAFVYGISPDLTPLITLIGAVIGETLSYGIYAAKSKAENTEGGIVYEAARWAHENNVSTPPENDDGSCG